MNTNCAITIRLRGGTWSRGECLREGVLRPLIGDDEAFLLEVGEAFPPSARTTALLARCLVRLGPFEPVTPELAASLTVGDREALLLHLRHLTLGERLS